MITADYYLYKYLCTWARCYYDFMKEMKHRTNVSCLNNRYIDTECLSKPQTSTQTKQTEGHENRRLSARPSETGPISQITYSKIHL